MGTGNGQLSFTMYHGYTGEESFRQVNLALAGFPDERKRAETW